MQYFRWTQLTWTLITTHQIIYTLNQHSENILNPRFQFKKRFFQFKKIQISCSTLKFLTFKITGRRVKRHIHWPSWGDVKLKEPSDTLTSLPLDDIMFPLLLFELRRTTTSWMVPLRLPSCDMEVRSRSTDSVLVSPIMEWPFTRTIWSFAFNLPSCSEKKRK